MAQPMSGWRTLFQSRCALHVETWRDAVHSTGGPKHRPARQGGPAGLFALWRCTEAWLGG
jgi:hypothetical protein